MKKSRFKPRLNKDKPAVGVSRNRVTSMVTIGTKEWSDHSVNCCDGCRNDCRYYFSKSRAIHYGRATQETWHIMKVRRKDVLKSYQKMEGRVMFPTSHDIVDIPEVEEACLAVLGKLLAAENEVLLTTKPRLSITRKVCEQFPEYKDLIQFRFTITSCHDELLKFWEPNAPLFQERMNSLMYAFEKGFKTSVSIEPFLDYDPVPLIRTVEPYSTESVWIGKMNYIAAKGLKEDEKPFYEAIRKGCTLTRLKEIYSELKSYPKIRFKDSIRNAIARATN